MTTKGYRYSRNKKLRTFFNNQPANNGNWLDLQNMTEEEKDSMYEAIGNCIPTPTVSISTFMYDHLNNPCPTPIKKAKVTSTIEENTMNTTVSFESERRALRDLLYSLERTKLAELRKACHLDHYHPKTIAEVKQLLKDGKVTVDPCYENDYDEEDESVMEYRNPSCMLVFNYQKPDKVACREGR